MCDEMKKLRKMLDERGIEWKDKSDHNPFLLNIDRTHFIHKSIFYSVINGYGTYGGYTNNPKDNQGLLEVMINHNNDPEGWLTANDIMSRVEKGVLNNV